MGVEERDSDETCDANSDVQVAGEILGPGSSEVSEKEDVDEDRLGAWEMYRWIPFVEGSPYSLAIATSIDPTVGWSGISLPRLHLLALSAPVEEVDGGKSDMGGMTVSRKGEGRVGCPLEDPAGESERAVGLPTDKPGGIDGTSIPNDWAIRPNCLGDKGLVGGRYFFSSSSGPVSSVSTSSAGSARSLPFILALVRVGSNASVGIFRDGKSNDSNVPVTGVTSGVLRGVGFAGQARSGEVMAGAVEPRTAMSRGR